MNTKEKTKLLTMGLLCCGRPETTERCLQSLMPIREAIDSEIQVVDTGCSPETRAVIEKYADEVFEFQWCNDFAAARNFQLDQANGKMFLFLDDDEWFLDTTNVIKFFKDPECTKFNIGGYYQRNYLDFQGKEYQDTIVNRMMSVTPETHFIGKVHEYIEPSYGNAMFMDAQVGHFGYVYVSQEDNERHAMRNIPLLKEMRAEQPDNLRWPYQLAQEYKSIFDFANMYEICKEGYEQSLRSEEGDDVKYRGNFLCGMAFGLMKQEGKEDELIALYEREMKKPTVAELPLTSLNFMAANVFFSKERNEECKKACDYYLKIYDKLGEDRGQQFLQGGLFVDELFEETKMNMVYCFLMTIGMDKDDYGPLTHYYRRINWNANVVRLNRGFMIMLLKKSSEIGYKKEIRDVLNKFFVKAGFRNLMQFQIEKVYLELSEKELENIKAAFKTTDGQKEMDAFMDVRLLEKQFAAIEHWDDIGELVGALQQYVNAVQNWKKLHDSWLNEDGVEEVLPREVQLANGLQQFIDICEKNVTTALKDLTNLFGIRIAMNTALGELSRLYVTAVRIDDIKRKEPEKFQEMYALEEQVLQQIADLDAAGKTDEAVAMYQQLVGILKNTFDVETLHV